MCVRVKPEKQQKKPPNGDDFLSCRLIECDHGGVCREQNWHQIEGP